MSLSRSMNLLEVYESGKKAGAALPGGAPSEAHAVDQVLKHKHVVSRAPPAHHKAGLPLGPQAWASAKALRRSFRTMENSLAKAHCTWMAR
jgi:hypothetical protein